MPRVYVRLREGGENEGVAIPADGRVRLTPVSVPDAEAWVVSTPTVLDVVGGVAEPVEVSPGRWRVDAVAPSWARRWTLDLEDSDETINLATLTPVDPAEPLPWLPTAADLAAAEEYVSLAENARVLAELAADLRAYPLMSESRGDGTATISGWLASRRDTGVVHVRSMPTFTDPDEHWSVNRLASMQGRRVSSLDIVYGRLYSGFGDWTANGDRVGVVSHDVTTGEARVDFFPVDTEAIEKVVPGEGGAIYVPHIDGNKSYWGGCGYAYYDNHPAGGRWTNHVLPGQALHVFDMVETDEGVWACGSAIPDDQSGGTAAVWFRPHDGEWSVWKRNDHDGTKGSFSRFYYLATDGHTVRVHDTGADPRQAFEMTADSVTEIPGVPSGRWAYVEGAWSQVSTSQKVIDGRVYDRPPGVTGTAWTVHDGYLYYASGNGGINRKEL